MDLLEAELTKEYIGTKYEQYIQVFTDTSKDPQNDQVEVAYIIPRELPAIMIAMNKIIEMGLNKTLKCSDSSLALLYLDAQQSETRQDIAMEILLILYMLQVATDK